MPTLTPEEKLEILWDTEQSRKGQMRTLVGIGVIFWGVACTVVWNQLEDMEATFNQVNNLGSALSLIEYVQGEQNKFNTSITARQEQFRLEVDARFTRLYERLNQMNSGSN